MSYTRYYNNSNMSVQISSFLYQVEDQYCRKIMNDLVMALYDILHIRRFIFHHATLKSLAYLQLRSHNSHPYICIRKSYLSLLPICLSKVLLSHTMKSLITQLLRLYRSQMTMTMTMKNNILILTILIDNVKYKTAD